MSPAEKDFRTGKGLPTILARLKSFHGDIILENRSQNTQRRIDSYHSLEEAKLELNQALLIYKNIIFNDASLQNDHAYQLFKKTTYDKSNHHPMEELDIETHHKYNIDGTPSKDFRKKTLNYLDQYWQDVIISYLFYINRSQFHNKEKEIIQIETVNKLLANDKETSFREIMKLSSSSSPMTIPIFFIVNQLRRTDKRTLHFLELGLFGKDFNKAVKMKDILLESINDKDVRDITSKKLSSLNIKKNPQRIIEQKEKRPIPAGILKRMEEILIGKGILEQLIDTNIKEVFLNLGLSFGWKDYEKDGYKALKKMHLDVDNKTLKSIVTAFRQSFQDLLNKPKLNNDINLALTSYFKDYDFSKVDNVISQILFDNFNKSKSSLNQLKDFVKIPGILQAITSLRKMYLISKLRQIILQTDSTDNILTPARGLITDGKNQIKSIFKKTPKKRLSFFFTRDLLDVFFQINDDDIANQWLFYSIEEKVKAEKELFSQSKVIIHRDGTYEIEICPDFLCPIGSDVEISVEDIKVSIFSENYEENDHFFIKLFRGSALLTIIPIEKIEYVV